MSFPQRHKLQFLQTACEKLVKAHLCGRGSDPAGLQSSHAYVAKHLPKILDQYALSVGFLGRKSQEALKHARRLAREIELLAPAVTRGGLRQDNCEYPRVSGGELRIPLNWTFLYH